LESGRSETGVWAASSASEAQLFPNLIAGTISFPIRLAAARPATDAVFIDAAQTALNPEARPEKIKEACGAHGTLADPTAERGYLCVYTGVEAFNDVDTAGALVSNKDAKFLTIAGALGDPGASTSSQRRRRRRRLLPQHQGPGHLGRDGPLGSVEADEPETLER
jgi:hypothetical protein